MTPGPAVIRTFTLATGAGPADTAVTCNISNQSTSCTYQSNTGVAVIPTDAMVISAVADSAPANTDASCAIFYTVDAF